MRDRRPAPNEQDEVNVAHDNIMIDLETLGTRPGCSILSIGACEFGAEDIGKQFYKVVNLESCSDWGLKIEPRTTLWWLEQGEDARIALLKAQGQSQPLDIALNELIAAFKWKNKKVWCNGASFDFPILTAAFDAVGLREPWQYWDQMDYRTLKGLVPREVYEKCKVDAGVKHHALMDAIAQAYTTINIMKHLAGGSKK